MFIDTQVQFQKNPDFKPAEGRLGESALCVYAVACPLWPATVEVDPLLVL